MSLLVPGLVSELSGGVRVWRAGDGPALVCLSGPPVSALVFRHLVRPVVDSGRALVLPELLHPPPDRVGIPELARGIAPLLDDRAVLLSHGLAHPVALELAAHTPAAGVALMNGPLPGVGSSVVRSALAAWSLGPARSRLPARWLFGLQASSAFLRRTVSDPHVMDRDIVAMLCAPSLATPRHRRVTGEYLRLMSNMRCPDLPAGLPVALLWSTGDPAHPLPRTSDLPPQLARAKLMIMEGARYYAIEHQPWRVGERVLHWWAEVAGDRSAT